MNSKSAYFSSRTASHGFDDIGFEQASGSFTSVTEAGGHAGGRYSGKAIIESEAHGLKAGQPINITNTTDYNGLTRVLHVIDVDNFIIDKDYVESGDEEGDWDITGGQSAWDSFMPLDDLPIGAITTLTFWKTKEQTGDEKLSGYEKGKLYHFPGIIKTILLAQEGVTVRLFRHATNNPQA